MTQLPLSANQCQYKGCQESVWPKSSEGFCLYHAKENGESCQNAADVWEEARKRARCEPCASCSGWHFPIDPMARTFMGMQFRRGPCFAHARFVGSVSFDGAHFGPGWVTDFDDVTFEGIARFQQAVFADAAYFRSAVFHKSAVFSQAEFTYIALVNESEFWHGADWGRAWFKTAVDFSGTEIKSTVFRQGEASYACDLQWVRIERNAEFRNVAFCGNAIFQNAAFRGNAVFENCQFDKRADFHGASYLPGKNIALDLPRRGAASFVCRAQGMSAYRLAKEAAFARRDLHLADLYAFYEVQATAVEKPSYMRAIHLLGVLPHRALIGLANWPWWLALCAAVIIVGLAGGYVLFNTIAPSGLRSEHLEVHDTTWNEALHLSVVTFATLGYGDLRPKPGSWLKCVADLEAVCGLLRAALFVVLLTRKYLA